MSEDDWIAFLQWALPRMHMRWGGFRKVRGQVIKRLADRLRQLGLPGVQAYREFLEQQPAEWAVLDSLCRVTISRFYRDRQMFAMLEESVLPEIVDNLLAKGESRLRVWSAGCAAGEEPYTVAIVWLLGLQAHFPAVSLDILSTDADAGLLERAAAAVYPHSSIKNLPIAWRQQVFDKSGDRYCLRPEYQTPVRFLQHDIRERPPEAPFHLILCRNLIFTYFDSGLQLTCLQQLQQALAPGGYLIVSVHEQLPEQAVGFVPISRRLGIYQFKDRPPSSS